MVAGGCQQLVNGSPANGYTLSATAAGLASAGSTPFDVNPGPAPPGPSWTQLTPGGLLPPVRQEHAAAIDVATGEMLVFGGDQPTNLNDFWTLSSANGVGAPFWTEVFPVGTAPAPRVGHSLVYDAANSRIVVFGGGLGATSPCVNDLWVLDGAVGPPLWTALAPVGGPPAVRKVRISSVRRGI